MTPRRLLLHLLAAAAHGSGWNALERRRRHRSKDYRLFILEYHDLCADGDVETEGVVRAGRLATHLAWLASRFRLVTVAQGAAWLAQGGEDTEGRDGDRLAVTFDDGYRSNYEHGLPVLRRADTPATVYLATGFVDGEPLWFDVARLTFAALRGREGALPAATQDTLRRAFGRWPLGGGEVAALKYVDTPVRLEVLHVLRDLQLDLPAPRQAMSWQQVQEMQQAGHEMGAHTVTHPILSRQSPSQQEAEILGSRQRITEATGVEPSTFAIPNGSSADFDATTLEILHGCGLRACCTTIRGSNRRGDPPLTLRRLGVGADSTAILATRLAGLMGQGLRRFLPKALRSAPGQ